MVQYNPFQGDGSASASGVVSIPAEPAAARVVFKGGRLLMPSAANGSIIAVSYEARARGVTRFFRGREAIAKCPEIVLVQVPTAHGKSDMGIYRSFGARVLKIISETCGAGSLTEKASVDEVYVDVTAPARRALAAAACASEVLDAFLPISPKHLPYISPTSPIYLPYISHRGGPPVRAARPARAWAGARRPAGGRPGWH